MVKEHHVRVYKSEENLPREDQLAYKIAEVAADPVEVTAEVTDMVINRIIDNASVAIASLNRAPDRRRPRPGAEPTAPAPAARAPTVFGIDGAASRPNGRPGPTASPSANSTTTTPSSPPSTPTRATTSRRSSPSPSTSAPAART